MTNVTDLSDAELEAIAGDDHEAFTRAAAARIGVRPELAMAVRKQESRGNQGAVSPKGALGQFQLMPGTAADLGVNPSDPYDNVIGGLTYLKRQIDDFGGDERLGLAAYNAGPEAVRKHGGVPPFKETQEYVASILGDHDQASPDITNVPDEELEAIARGAPPEAEAEPDKLPDFGIKIVPSGGTAMKTSDGRFVDAEEGNPLTSDQGAWYERQIKAGKADSAKMRADDVRWGSKDYPLAQRDPRDLPKPGDWYLTPGGELKQVPADSALATLESASQDISAHGLVPEEALDPRYAAAKRALQSGVLLGGRNELASAIESLPKLGGGWDGYSKAFGENLSAEDAKSAQARRNFPTTYNGSAVAGALMGGFAAPEGLLPRLATGAAGGFLSTDGGLADVRLARGWARPAARR
jgi:hypothetical protein